MRKQNRWVINVSGIDGMTGDDNINTELSNSDFCISRAGHREEIVMLLTERLADVSSSLFSEITVHLAKTFANVEQNALLVL